MRKWIILSILICFMIPLVNGLEICGDKPRVEPPCIMTTPELTTCSIYNYTITDVNQNRVENGSLEIFTGLVYSFNLSVGKGDYIVRICDGGVREIFVGEEDNMLGLIIGFIAIAVFFIWIGMINDSIPAKMAAFGMTLIQIFNIVAISYAVELGRSLIIILKINFLSILIIGLGLASYSLYIFTMRSVDMTDTTLENPPKWLEK